MLPKLDTFWLRKRNKQHRMQKKIEDHFLLDKEVFGSLRLKISPVLLDINYEY